MNSGSRNEFRAGELSRSAEGKAEKTIQRFLAQTIAVILALVITASGAIAGEKLLFKSGTVDTTKIDSSRYSAVINEGPAFYIVQFKNKIRDLDRRSVIAKGGLIVRYLPEDALVVKADAKLANVLRTGLSGVHAVIPYAPEWKVSPEFAPASVFSAQVTSKVVARLFPGENAKKIESKIRAIEGLKVLDLVGRSVVVNGTRSQIDELALIPEIEWVEQYPEMELMHFKLHENEGPVVVADPVADYTSLTGFETGTKLMKLDVAWSRGFTGRGQTVAMADTGLDVGVIEKVHQDFANRIPIGFAFGMHAKNWEDPNGHGSHVAGSVTSTGQASGGLIKGAAYDASFIPQGMWSPILNNLTVPPRVSDLFQKAMENGARIHTNSWGSPRNLGAYDSFAQQVDEFVAANPEMLILFAAGNSGIDADKDGRIDPLSVSSPGTAKNVLTVGASKNLVSSGGIQRKLSELGIGRSNWPAEPIASTKLSDNPQGLAPFSSRGPTADGRLKPEVVAPGTNILSNKSQHPSAQPLWGPYDSNYNWSGGTSMSTPLVAGAAAVVRQYLTESRQIYNPSSALMKAVLMHTAFDLYPGQFGEVGKSAGQELLTTRPNMDQGYGRVDVDRATDLAGAILIDERIGLSTGEVHAYPLQVRNETDLIATMVYTDAAASAGSSKALVNDLNIVLVTSQGLEMELVNDSVNNNEIIQRRIPAGNYEIQVRGANVPMGPASGKQPYALVITAK